MKTSIKTLAQHPIAAPSVAQPIRAITGLMFKSRVDRQPNRWHRAHRRPGRIVDGSALAPPLTNLIGDGARQDHKLSWLAEPSEYLELGHFLIQYYLMASTRTNMFIGTTSENRRETLAEAAGLDVPSSACWSVESGVRMWWSCSR